MAAHTAENTAASKRKRELMNLQKQKEPHKPSITLTDLSPAPQGRWSTRLFSGNNQTAENMKKRTFLTETATENDLIVDLTLHGFPAILLTEFAEKIVRPYYHGNLNQALKELMEQAITEQQLLQSHIIKP
jgi:hypothetical protein